MRVHAVRVSTGVALLPPQILHNTPAGVALLPPQILHNTPAGVADDPNKGQMCIVRERIRGGREGGIPI